MFTKEDVAPFRNVNGAEVALSDAERQVICDEWNVNEVLRPQFEAASARRVSDENERAACKGDSAMLTLINQTRAEWTSWAQANFPSLTAPERNRMGTICWLLAVAVRKLMR